MKKIINLMFLCIFAYSATLHAKSPHVFEITVDKPMEQVYDKVYQELEKEGFYVVFEPFISKNLSRFEKKWGDKYNQNKLDSIRSMVFCNGWYANMVSNTDPSLLALCPLRMTLYEKNGATTALFAKPTVIAADSPAHKVLQHVEDDVIAAITKGMTAK